jgi:drug/metabolite transporter (DMT)-like permease
MAQTKRKRRTKHRGNAVGIVESRGRTGKRPEGASRPAARGGRPPARPLKPPTLKSAALKGLVGAVVLFVFFNFLSKGTTTTQAFTMCLVALVFYTPVMYLTDKWVYNRKLRQQQQAGGARR